MVAVHVPRIYNHNPCVTLYCSGLMQVQSRSYSRAAYTRLITSHTYIQYYEQYARGIIRIPYDGTCHGGWAGVLSYIGGMISICTGSINPGILHSGPRTHCNSNIFHRVPGIHSSIPNSPQKLHTVTRYFRVILSDYGYSGIILTTSYNDDAWRPAPTTHAVHRQ